jgi:signal transduction histidine kinase
MSLHSRQQIDRHIPAATELRGTEAVVGERTECSPEHALVDARIERAADRAIGLLEMTTACSAARTPADVAAVGVTLGCTALGAPRGLMYLLDDDGAALELVRVNEYPPEVVAALQRIPVDIDAPIPEVVRTGEALFFETAEAVLTRYPHLVGARSPGDNALAVVPLVVGGHVPGALGFIFREAHPFDAEERIFILALARQCAQALDRARLYEAAERACAVAEAANRAKDEFLATLSHELRTPLTAILGWSNILRTRAPEPLMLGRGLQTIERNAQALVQLIENVLDVSGIVAGNLHVELGLVEPAVIVRGAIDLVQGAAEAKEITIDAVIEDGMAPLAADGARLQQITWNLLSNAIKFTRKGGRIEVRLDRIGAGVRLRVIDAGLGIDAAFLPRIFDRFQQADTSKTRAHGGLGLGLAIVKHLVERHDGTITAESKGVGLGATFTVTIPTSL